MRITKLTFMLIALVALTSLAGYFGSETSSAAPMGDSVNAKWKGTESFSLTSAGPNVARCGAFPENVELSFSGSGIDTEGGVFDVVASACTNTITNLIFDLKATDTYVQSGDQVFIEADSFVQIINPANCVASNSHAVMGACGRWHRRKGRLERSRALPVRKQPHAVQRSKRARARVV